MPEKFLLSIFSSSRGQELNDEEAALDLPIASCKMPASFKMNNQFPLPQHEEANDIRLVNDAAEIIFGTSKNDRSEKAMEFAKRYAGQGKPNKLTMLIDIMESKGETQIACSLRNLFEKKQ